MSIACKHCGKTIEETGISFCPFCGVRIEERKEKPDAEAETWIRKAMAVTSFPKRKEILEEGLRACPDSREIRWELLFIGEKDPKPPKGRMDFSIIKCSLLQMYRFPDDYPEEKKETMRAQLFTDPKLLSTLQLFEDQEAKHREYLERICEEYIEVFMEDDNRLMNNFLGFRLSKNKEKLLAAPCADIIGRIRTDTGLTGEQRALLADMFYRAFSVRMGGNTEYLDAELP